MKFKLALTYVAVLACLAKGADKLVTVVLSVYEKSLDAETAARQSAETAGLKAVTAAFTAQHVKTAAMQVILNRETEVLVALGASFCDDCDAVTAKAFSHAI